MDKELEKLIDEYGNDVLRVAYMYLKDRHLAEDAFQEIFIKVYKNFDKFEGKSSVKTWILTITMNTCKDILRSSWLKRLVFNEDLKSDNPTGETSVNIEEEVIKQLQYDELFSQVIKLPNKLKEIVILFYYQDFSTAEISKILKTPEGTVRSRLFRAREMLKINLDGKISYE